MKKKAYTQKQNQNKVKQNKTKQKNRNEERKAGRSEKKGRKWRVAVRLFVRKKTRRQESNEGKTTPTTRNESRKSFVRYFSLFKIVW